MNDKVDVLAEMERASNRLFDAGLHGGLSIEEARAAVAELIEAAESYAEDEAALANRELAGINAEPHEKMQRRVHSAREQLDAALARVKGE